MHMGWYRQQDEFKFWTWYWWNELGRQGGIRGNWDVVTNDWQIGNVEVVQHKGLGSYLMSGGFPPYLADGFFCEDEFRLFYVSVGNKMELKFYDDLEQCHVAALLGHGGPAGVPGSSDEPFQVRARIDYRFVPHDAGDPGFGVGNLRYLLLGNCSSMNWLKEPPAPGGGLAGDWMTPHVSAGLRMACGHDGLYGSADHEGWVFFQHYHLGDSVTDSWHLSSMLDPHNHPVTVAYGGSEAEAVATLYDERFDRAKAKGGWIIALESFVVPFAD